ncbi:MAG TPA: ribonuclease P protein component [Cyclobacteriaceae bacterium]|jgi:ribonuclease P protein component|nr:ribonuclease P protein component [Cyclobacteriaceae bacterium]
MEKLTLKKSERLSQKKLIEELFDKGSSFYLYPFKVFFLPSLKPINQVMATVPKSIFKRAVDRNTIKRRIREGYRLNKAKLASDNFFSIAYIYTAKEILPSALIHQKIILSFDKLIHQK